MIGFPLAVPVDGYKPRRMAVDANAGDVFTQDDDFDGITLTIELTTPQEVTAVTDWLANRRPPQADGGPI